MNFDAALSKQTQQLASQLQARSMFIATAESCTGGLLSALFTSLPGSSVWFDRGFVTYSNTAKHQQIGVPMEVIKQHGAVSIEVALMMAQETVAHSDADCAIAITGIAGPTGGTAQKPVGTVCFAWHGFGDKDEVQTQLFDGDRVAVRQQSVEWAINEAVRLLEK